VDNFSISGKRQMAFAFLGGCIFNLANMLLVAAISVAGLAVAFPVGIGLALVIGVFWNYLLRPTGSPLLLFAGAGLVVLAIVVDALAYRAHASQQAAGGSRVTTRGIVLSLLSGILMGSFYPFVQMSMAGDIGLLPYAAALVFAVGVFLSTFIFNVYFMNLPVVGAPLSVQDYFKGGLGAHALGLVGGAIWCVGAITNFVAGAAPADVRLGPAVSYGLGQGATMISALWGLLVWREFQGATSRVYGLIALMFVLFLVGLTLVSIAPLYGNT
jgi:glucose uptake protein